MHTEEFLHRLYLEVASSRCAFSLFPRNTGQFSQVVLTQCRLCHASAVFITIGISHYVKLVGMQRYFSKDQSKNCV